MELHGMRAVVVGGSSGIGLATAKLVKEQGASVTIAGRSSTRLRQAVEQIGDARTVVADIANEVQVEAIFQELDRVDHVFISAGRMLLGKVVETDLETFRADVNQRFWGPLFVVRSVVPKMTGGSITFLSGQYASKPASGAVITATMSAAIEAMARGLALELAPIRVNVVAPGLIDTRILGEHRYGANKWAEESLPVKRMGLAEEVAQAVVLLMTNEFITGEVLHIDGGGRLI